MMPSGAATTYTKNDPSRRKCGYVEPKAIIDAPSAIDMNGTALARRAAWRCVMTAVPLHPALVHLPVGLAIALPLLALALAVALWLRIAPPLAFLLLAGLQVMMLVGGSAAYRAGEEEEERVESLVSEDQLTAHQQRAQIFLWSAGIALAMSAATATVRKTALARSLAVLSVAASVITAAAAIATGKAGGEIAYGSRGPALSAPSRGDTPTTSDGDDD